MILTISGLLMMFTNLMQRTRKIIQEKYLLKADNEAETLGTATGEPEATDQQIEEKSQEMKNQVYGRYLDRFLCCVLFFK